MNKSILFIIPSLHVGGAESQLCLVLPLLHDKGWDITIFLTSGIGELAEQLEMSNIKIIKPKFMNTKQRITNKLLRLPYMLLSLLRLTYHLIRHKPKIVHFTLTEAYLLGGLSCMLVGQKNLIMSRRSLNNYQNKYPLLAKIEHWLHTKMDIIVSNSKIIHEQLATLEAVPLHKLRLIYNGIDMQRFINKKHEHQMIRQQFNLSNSTLTFIVIANILPYKGHATLLRALGTIDAQLPQNWQLLCVGRKSDYCIELEAMAQELNIATHVYFLGQQPTAAVEQLLAIANIAISPSYEEGLSNAIIEAIAAGVPLIVTDVGGNPEIVTHNKTGLIIPSKDMTALSTAILTLVRNPQRAAELVTNGKQHVQQHFSLDACADAYHQLYMEILKS